MRNFFLTLIVLFVDFILTFLSYYFHPLKFLKIKGWCLLSILPLIPFLISKATSSIDIFYVQALLLIFSLSVTPAGASFIKHFSVLKRFRSVSILYAISRAFVYLLTSFGLIYLMEIFGWWGILWFMVPITIAYLWGVYHFQYLEEEAVLEDEQKVYLETMQSLS